MIILIYTISKKQKIIYFLLILLLFILLLPLSYSYYIIQKNSSVDFLNLKEIYFESDILKDNSNNRYTISNYNEGEEILFNIDNFADNIRASKEDVIYTISSYIIDANGDKTLVDDIIQIKNNDISKKSYTLTSGFSSHTLAISIPTSYFKDNEATIEVIAKAISPFEKEISAIFTIFLPFENTYIEVSENENKNTAMITISSYELTGKLILQYNNIIFPDRTSIYINTLENSNDKDIIIGTNDNKSQLTIDIQPYSAYQITFFKNTSEYTVIPSDFIIINASS